MPELPEVETVMRALTPLMQGQTITRAVKRRKNLRTPLPARLEKTLAGARILSLVRRAKYILIHLDNDHSLIVHLGMTGGFFVRNTDAPPQKHDHILFDLGSGARLTFCDPRRFGSVDLVRTANLATHPALTLLGPEPLGPDFTAKILAARLAGKKTPIKSALLDQRVIAGLGNIYVAEALFYAGIDPRRAAGNLAPNEIKPLAQAIRRVLRAAITAGGSTLRDYRHPDGNLGFFQDRFAVYGRNGQSCPGCTCVGGKITRLVMAGRSSFFCPVRQK